MADKTIFKNWWLTMWVEPRQTIKSIVRYNPKFRFLALSAVYGFCFFLHLSQVFSLGEFWPLSLIFIVSLILGTFIGMAVFSISSLLLMWTGRWIGGKAPYINIRAAVSWANVTNTANIVLWLILIGVFGKEVFNRTFAERTFNGYEMGIVSTIFILQTVLGIWSLILLLKGLGEVQGFSAWKAFLNVIIAFVLIVVVFWVIGLLAWWIQGMQ